MYTLLTSEKLLEMRKENEERLKLNEDITSLKKKSMNKKEPFLFEDPLMDLCADLHVNGNVFTLPHGVVMSHGLMPFYYRGEVKEHKTCYSSLFRIFEEIGDLSKDQKIRKVFLNQLRISEFSCLINNLIQAGKWHYGSIFVYAIAQHYGFDTDIIDFTNDLDVALFFACCKYDKENNNYLPLTENDIRCKYRYGYLYERRAYENEILLTILNQRILSERPLNDHLVITSAVEDSDWVRLIGKPRLVLPIGYQPFSRCNRQKGYFIHPHFGDDTRAENYFETIYKFEHSVELSEELCKKYKSGDELFNCEIGDELSDIIEKIKNATTFSYESFEDAYYYLHHLHEDFTREDWKKDLTENEEIAFGKADYELSNEKIETINKKWSIKKFIKEEKIQPGKRKIFSNSGIDDNFLRSDVRVRELLYILDNPDYYNSLKNCVSLRKNAIRERKRGKNKSRKPSAFKK